MFSAISQLVSAEKEARRSTSKDFRLSFQESLTDKEALYTEVIIQARINRSLFSITEVIIQARINRSLIFRKLIELPSHGAILS